MAFLPEQSVWSEAIYQLEIQDGPAGGPDGVDNVPIKQLADRTRFLYDRQNSILDENGAFGYEIPFDFEPTALELATWRCLPLRGQIIQISLYQRLCDKMYVGNAANTTADWWYKCDADGTRNVNGAYMRVLDKRGLFTRADGQNSKHKMANDAPYDGKAIGEFQTDKIRVHTHAFGGAVPFDGQTTTTGLSHIRVTGSDAMNQYTGPNPVVSTGNSESAPASISAYFCIKY